MQRTARNVPPPHAANTPEPQWLAGL